MGMDWHSSGITTSVIGALKRGLNPRAAELGLYVCGVMGAAGIRTAPVLLAIAQSEGSRRRGAGPHQSTDSEDRQQLHRGRISDLPALLRAGCEWRVVDCAARAQRRIGTGAALPLAFGERPRFRRRPAHGNCGCASRHDHEPGGRAGGAGAAGADRDGADGARDDAARRAPAGDASSSRCASGRRRSEAAGRSAGCGSRTRVEKFRRLAAGGESRSAHAADDGDGGRGGTRRAVAIFRPCAIFVRAGR